MPDDPSGSSCLVAGSCLVLLISWVVADWLFQKSQAFQLAGFGLLSVAALVGLGHAHILLPLVVGVLSDPNLFDLKGWLRLWEYLLQFGMRIVDSVLDVMNLWLR